MKGQYKGWAHTVLVLSGTGLTVMDFESFVGA